MVLFVTVFYSFLLVSHFIFSDEGSVRESGSRTKIQASIMKEKEAAALKNLNARPELVGALSLGFTAVFFLGLCLDAAFVMKKWRPSPFEAGSLAGPAALWGGRDVLEAFLFLFFMEGCLFLVQGGASFFLGLDGHIPDGALLLNSLARDLGVACFVIWIVRKRYGQDLSALGFRVRGLWTGVRSGILAYIAVIPPMLVCFMVLAAALHYFSIEPGPQDVVEIYLKDSTRPILFVLTLFVAIAGPVMEEVFFRGFAYAGLRRRFGVWPGAVMSSALFAALHMHWVAFFPIFFLGMFLAALYEISGSLVPSITAHALHNTVMVGVMLGFRGLSSG